MLFCLLALLCSCLHAQKAGTYIITGDSVRLTSCDSSELIIENHTQDVPGFLFNTGRGRTIFQRALLPVAHGSWLIGVDTLNLAANAWLQGGNSFGTTGILGTIDNNPLDFYTNNTFRGRLTADGKLLLGTNSNPYNDVLVAQGTASFGNGIKLNNGDPNLARVYSDTGIQIQSNARTNYQIWMHNMIGAAFSGPAVVSMGTAEATLGPTQCILQISGNAGVPIAFFKANGNTMLGTQTDNGRLLQVNGSSYFNGPQQTTGTLTTMPFAIFNPTVSVTSGEWSSGSAYEMDPTLNMTDNNQQAYALDISPTFNMNGYTQGGDAISAGLHIGSNEGGIRIDQTKSYSGTTGQPLLIYQGETSDKEAIHNYRNGNATSAPFIWDHDNRPSSTDNLIVPAIRSTITSPLAGGGVSWNMDRYYYGTDASIDMHYETAPDTTANINTTIAFHTSSSSAGRVTPLYITGPDIGIGTTTPSAQFHTTGSVRFAGLTQDSTQTHVLVSDASGNLYYRSASSLAAGELIRSSLTVNGPIRSKKIIISPDVWADYVLAQSGFLYESV